MVIQKKIPGLILFFLMLLIFLAVGSASAQLPWPIENTANDHPIGNSFGEFQQFDGGALYMHTGLDIREDCAPAGPWVRSVIGGTLSLSDSGAGSRYNGVTIVNGTTTYRYWHLDHNSITLDVRNADTNATAFAANTRIARLVDWTAQLGNFHHLHFRMYRGANNINPYTDTTTGGVRPMNDDVPPQVSEILICRNNSNTFLAKPAVGCWIVDGDLDIIARASDVDPPNPSIAWQSNIGVYRIEYSINELSGTGTHNVPIKQLYRFDAFPTPDGGAQTPIIFKNVAPADSNSDYWTNGAERSYYIVTNVDAGGNLSEANGFWDTNGGGFPDGLYQISVAAYDIVGNHHTRSEIVYVRNTPGSPAPVEFYIRDRAGDDGSVPSNPNGEAFWVSPDIRVDAPPFGIVNSTGLPFGSNDHENPIFGQQNRIYVRVYNRGCATSGQARIYLYWADPSGGIPPSDWNEIDPATVKNVNAIPAGGSAEYSPYIPWTPSGTAIGHRCLLVRLVSEQDPITSDYNVPGDNNIGQKNLTVVPPPTDPSDTSFFIVNPTKERAYIHLIVDRSNYPKDAYLAIEIPYEPTLFRKISEIKGVRVIFKVEEQNLEIEILDDRVDLYGFLLNPNMKIQAKIKFGAIPEPIPSESESTNTLVTNLDTLTYLPKTTTAIGLTAALTATVAYPQRTEYTVEITQKVNNIVTGGLTFVIPIETGTGTVCPPEQAAYKINFVKGINLINVPLDPGDKWYMSDLAKFIGKGLTYIVWYDEGSGKFISYFPDFPKDSPANKAVSGDDGYIVIMESPKTVTFIGKAWSNTTVPAAPALMSERQVLVLNGLLLGGENGELLQGIKVIAFNPRSGKTVYSITGEFGIPGRYTLTFVGADIANPGEVLTISILDPYGQQMTEPVKHQVTQAELEMGLMDIANFRVPLIPGRTELLVNYPNPFNPETWVPFRLSESANVTIEIYNASGQIVRELKLGYREAGSYISRARSAYWDGKNSSGEPVASGIYFYVLRAGKFTDSRKMMVLK